jgi:hypothetical protein
VITQFIEHIEKEENGPGWAKVWARVTDGLVESLGFSTVVPGSEAGKVHASFQCEESLGMTPEWMAFMAQVFERGAKEVEKVAERQGIAEQALYQQGEKDG